MNDARRLARLPKELASALEPVIREARRSGVRIALVGGAVRDLLRGEPIGEDVDVVVEGDAGDFARRVAPAARVKVYGRFGTATIEPEDGPGLRIDLASARRERYVCPGALPEVERASLEEDLARRDFTVHAIAWEPAVRRLHDPFGGGADLAAGRIRVLHPRSFVDDPTRILRAVRYANRLGFHVEPVTRRLLGKALAQGALATVSGDRVRREISKLLSEPGWSVGLRRAAALGVLTALEPAWIISSAVRSALARAQAIASREPMRPDPRDDRHAWMTALLVAASELRGPARRRLATNLALAGIELRMFERWEAPPGNPRTRTREEAIARIALAPAAERKILERRLFAPVRLSIRGADLLRVGLPAGPEIGEALGETRRALEEGRIEPAEELEYALAAARRHGRKR